MKKIVVFIAILFLVTFITGCKPKKEDPVPKSIEIVSDSNIFDETFKLEDLTVRVHMSDGTFYDVDLDEDMLSESDLALLNQTGTHTIEVSYLSFTGSFEITINANDGEDGREVELQATDDFIQWRYVGETTWRNLIALNILKGDAGVAGKQVEFNTSATHIQWRYVGDTTWNNLVELASLKGANGTTPTITINNDGFWVINGTVTTIKAAGVAGREVELQTTTEYIQWRYKGETTWKNLIALNLLKGDTGATPTISINEDGYWVINGVVTTYKAVSEGDTSTAPDVKVTFDANGGIMPTGTSTEVTVPKGDPIDLPIPIREGYIFLGWFSGDTANDGQFLSFMGVVKDMTLKAKWIVDTAPIKAFFNTYKIGNYTVTDSNYSKVISTSNPEEVLYEVTTKVNKFGDYVITYSSELEKTFGPKGEEWIYNCFKVYYSHEGLLYEIYNDEEQETWSIYYYDDNFNDDYFEFIERYLDFTLFEKEVGKAIYHYQYTNELDEYIDAPYGFEKDIDITLNLETNELIMAAVLTGEDDKGEEVTIIYDSRIKFTDVSTTVVDIPIAEIKTFIKDQIDLIVNDMTHLLFIDKDTYDNFYNIINAYKDDIDGAEQVYELYHYLENYANYINNINIDFSNFAYYKADAYTYMMEIIEGYSEVATDESIATFNQILEDAFNALVEAETFDGVDEIVDAFVVEVDEAFEIDPDKELVSLIRSNYHNLISYITNILVNSTSDSFEIYELYVISNESHNAIADADTLEEMTIAFNDALTAFANYNITLKADALKNTKINLIYDITEVYDKTELIDNLNTELYEIYFDSMMSVLSKDNIGEAFIVYASFYNEFFIKFLANYRVYLVEFVETQLRPNLLAVAEEDKAALTELYNHLLNTINTRNNYEVMWEEYADLLSNYLNHFNYDYFILEIQKKINTYREDFKVMSEGATDQSIITMQAVLDYYISILEAANEEDDLDIIDSDFFNAMIEARDQDPQKFVNLIDLNAYLMYEWYNDLFDGQLNSYQILLSSYYYVSNYIYACNDKDIATALVNDWLDFIKALEYDYDETIYNNVKDSIDTYLEDLYDYLLSIPGLPDDLEETYSTYMAELVTITDACDYIRKAGEIELYLSMIAYNSGN